MAAGACKERKGICTYDGVVRRGFLASALVILGNRFTARTFRQREQFRDDYGCLAASLLRRVEFESVLDVGCANGFLLGPFQEAGKRVGGIELSNAVLKVLPPTLVPLVAVGDFALAQGRWDLVCCVEMAEHIQPRRSEELVDTLVRLAIRNIYFTAAEPGQSGRGHVNCRAHGEWLHWFAARGWRLDEERTTGVRTDLAALTKASWLQKNSLVLHRSDG